MCSCQKTGIVLRNRSQLRGAKEREDMFGTTGDLMNTIMASRIARERSTATLAGEQRRTPTSTRITLGSLMVASWHRVRTLVATVLA